MNYQGLIKAALDALTNKLLGLQGEDNKPIFKSVAITEPSKINQVRMPAAYILLDNDRIAQKTRYLETHTLSITISVIQVVKGTVHGDTELEKGLLEGLFLVGAVYDALAKDRTLGNTTGFIKVKDIEFGRTPLDVGVIFWGELQLEFDLQYAPGKPGEAPVIQDVGVNPREVI